jgi:hypothetical protein
MPFQIQPRSSCPQLAHEFWCAYPRCDCGVPRLVEDPPKQEAQNDNDRHDTKAA